MRIWASNRSVDLEDIRRLARGGIEAFPITSLQTAADWLWDYAEATGDARYCSLSRTVAMIWSEYEDHSEQIAMSTVDTLNEALEAGIIDVLNQPSATDGALIARQLRELVAAILEARPMTD